LEHVLFSMIYGIILPIDELIFFKMVKTINQLLICIDYCFCSLKITHVDPQKWESHRGAQVRLMLLYIYMYTYYTCLA